MKKNKAAFYSFLLKGTGTDFLDFLMKVFNLLAPQNTFDHNLVLRLSR
jgi:hypothetical protein